VTPRSRRARPSDIAALARQLPFSVDVSSSADRPIFQVGGRTFVFFRNPRPDAVGADGTKLPDVVVFWVASEDDKQSLVQDEDSPFFTTPHFDGHPSVLLRLADVSRLSLAELTEVVQDAWLSRASAKRARDWLASRNLA
jgi:hypothetical protein